MDYDDNDDSSPRLSSIPPELMKKIPAAEYLHMKQCQEQFDELAGWLLQNMSHQIGMGDLVKGEGAVDMVKRLLTPMADPNYMGHVSLVKSDEGAVCAFGSLWDPKKAVATYGDSFEQVLERLKEVIDMYSEEIAERWGPEVINGSWGPDTVSYQNQLVSYADALHRHLVVQGQSGLVCVEPDEDCLIVFLMRDTVEYEGPWHFGDRNIRVTIDYVENHTVEDAH